MSFYFCRFYWLSRETMKLRYGETVCQCSTRLLLNWFEKPYLYGLFHLIISLAHSHIHKKKVSAQTNHNHMNVTLCEEKDENLVVWSGILRSHLWFSRLPLYLLNYRMNRDGQQLLSLLTRHSTGRALGWLYSRIKLKAAQKNEFSFVVRIECQHDYYFLYLGRWNSST